MFSRRRRHFAGTQPGQPITGGRLIMGWPGPAGTHLRLARAGDERAVARYVRMAGVDEDDRPAIEGTRDGALACALIAAADHGRHPIETWVLDALRFEDPTPLWPAMTLVLVALDPDGAPIGALLAHPPMNIINYGILCGVPAGPMLATAAGLARFKALAIEPRWRGQGIGAALLTLGIALYDQLGFKILYGQILTTEHLEDYYPRFGFEVLNPGVGFSLSDLTGFPYGVAPSPGEQLIVQTRIRLRRSPAPTQGQGVRLASGGRG
jgi:GNAT superfamily N-acetyltransferase